MIDPRIEELAALHAFNLLDEAGERELLAAAQLEPDVEALIRDFCETAACLAHDAPLFQPPAHVKQELLQRLAAPRAPSRILAFPQWIPYAIAACLMVLGVVQTAQILHLKSRVRSLQSGLLADDGEVSRLRQTNAIQDLRLATLQASAGAQVNTAYASSRIIVAWDPAHHRGIISMRDLPAPPPGRDYQLWVLDPKSSAPIDAGLITASRSFVTKAVGDSNPGFAISLEPSGGRPAPTGPILFAATSSQ